MKIFFCLLVLFAMLSCNEGDTDFSEINFKDLPVDVQLKFRNIYNHNDKTKSNYLPPFSECINVNSRCDCTIEYQHNSLVTVIIPQKFVITSCGKTAKIPFSTLERVFIIKNDSIYYPFTFNGGMTAMGESRSNYIKIDTLKFHVKKMIKE